MAKKSIVDALGVKGITKKMMKEAEKHHQMFIGIWNSAVCAEHKSGIDFDTDGEAVHEDHDLRKACNDAATAIETGDEKLLLSTLPRLKTEALNVTRQFYENNYFCVNSPSSSRFGTISLLTYSGLYFVFDGTGKVIEMPNPMQFKKMKKERISKVIKLVGRDPLEAVNEIISKRMNNIIDSAKTRKPASKQFKKMKKEVRHMFKALNKYGNLAEKVYGLGHVGDDCTPYCCQINDALEFMEKILAVK